MANWKNEIDLSEQYLQMQEMDEEEDFDSEISLNWRNSLLCKMTDHELYKKDTDFQQCVNELQEASSTNEPDEWSFAFSNLYDYCDNARIWLKGAM